MFLSAIKRSGLHYQGCHDILYLWGGLLKKSGVFVNNMCLPELQVPPGSALSLCSVHAAFDRKESCVFNHVAYITETFASDPHTQQHRALAEMSQIHYGWHSLLNSKSAWTHCNTKDPQSRGKQWRVQISECSQWEFSVLLMRHVFHHSLWKVLSLFSWGLRMLQRKQEWWQQHRQHVPQGFNMHCAPC